MLWSALQATQLIHIDRELATGLRAVRDIVTETQQQTGDKEVKQETEVKLQQEEVKTQEAEVKTLDAEVKPQEEIQEEVKEQVRGEEVETEPQGEHLEHVKQ